MLKWVRMQARTTREHHAKPVRGRTPARRFYRRVGNWKESVLLCLTTLLSQPRRLTAQTVLSPEIQRRIESVCACLTTPVVETDDACQTLQDRMAADRVPGDSMAALSRLTCAGSEGRVA